MKIESLAVNIVARQGKDGIFDFAGRTAGFSYVPSDLIEFPLAGTTDWGASRP